jgi:hypothetical protein
MDFELTLDFYLHIHFQFGDGGNGIEPNTSPNQTNSFVFLLFNSIYRILTRASARQGSTRNTLRNNAVILKRHIHLFFWSSVTLRSTPRNRSCHATHAQIGFLIYLIGQFGNEICP